MAVVYKHRRLDSNEVFYVGIGKTLRRSTSKAGRNRYWHNIVKKCGYTIEIYKEKLTWEEACKLEIKLIKKYGRKDLGKGNLCNMTDGGEGALGRTKDYKERKSISDRNTGNTTRKGTKSSQATKDKIGKAHTKKVIDMKTKKIYESVTEVSTLFNININTLRGYIRIKKGNFRYYTT